MRLRWYKIRSSVEPTAFIDAVLRAKFSTRREWGFLPGNGDGLDGRGLKFLRKSVVVASTVDASGNSFSRLVKNVEQISVAIFSGDDSVWMRIIDPPRATRGLFSALQALGQGPMSIEPHLISEFERKAILGKFEDVRLVGLKGSGVSRPHKVVLRVDFASKEEVVRQSFPFLDDIYFSADQYSYAVSVQGIRGQVVFGVGGNVRVTGSIAPYIVSKVEGCLGIKN